MKTKYSQSTFVLGTLLAHKALAQNPLQNEQSQVCGMTLSESGAAIVRTNSWNLARNNGNSTLQQANFWITSMNNGARLYGSNGERCGFDPYLECDDDDDDDRDNTPFVIGSDGTLSFNNQSTFYLCSRNAFYEVNDDNDDDHDDHDTPDINEDNLQDYPYIYPPTGSINGFTRNYANCTQATLVADGCFTGSGSYSVSPSAAASSTTSLPTNSATAMASMTSVTAPGATGNTNSGTASGVANNGEIVGINHAIVIGAVGAAAVGFAIL